MKTNLESDGHNLVTKGVFSEKQILGIPENGYILGILKSRCPELNWGPFDYESSIPNIPNPPKPASISLFQPHPKPQFGTIKIPNLSLINNNSFYF